MPYVENSRNSDQLPNTMSTVPGDREQTPQPQLNLSEVSLHGSEAASSMEYTSSEERTDAYDSDLMSMDMSMGSQPSLLSPDNGLPTVEVEVEVEGEGDGRDYGDAASEYAMTAYPGAHSVYHHDRGYDGGGVEVGTITSTRSMYDEDFDFHEEHGRLYCGEYYMPIDEEERTRQYMLHRVYLRLFQNELTTVPLEDPENILDVGTGIGEWVLGMAERYPDCQVWGTDIAPIAETAKVWPNAWFEIDNAEVDWVRPADFFDLVHLRNMSGAFKDWPFIYEQAYQCVKPGGFVEVVEFDDHRSFRNFLDWFPPDAHIRSMSAATNECAIISGRPRGVGHLQEQLFIDAGFVDVEIEDYDLGIGTKESKAHGQEWLLALVGAIEPTSLRLLTRYGGWTADMVRESAEWVAQELMRKVKEPGRDLGFVFKLKVARARKPLVPGQWSAQALGENASIVESSGTSTISAGDVLDI